jgi:hypothetical protein
MNEKELAELMARLPEHLRFFFVQAPAGLDAEEFIRYSSDLFAKVRQHRDELIAHGIAADRFLADMVTTSRYSEPMNTFGYALTQMSSPEARLETLQRLRKADRLDAVKIPDAQLQQWGLTRQQVGQLQPPGR